MDKNELNEKLFDDILEYALKQECRLTAEELPTEEEMSKIIFPSLDFEKKMNALFRHERSVFRKKHVLRVVKRLAACVLAVIILNVCLIVSVEAYRTKIFNMYIDVKNEFTTFIFKDGENKSIPDIGKIPDDWQNVYLPSYIPEGFTIQNVDRVGEITGIVYSSKDSDTQTIYFSYSPLRSSIFSIDTENSDVIKIKISGEDGYISEKSINGATRTSIVWKNDTIAFTLTDRANTKTYKHEAGHSLGWFDHSTNSSDIMYATQTSTTDLTSRDKYHLTQVY